MFSPHRLARFLLAVVVAAAPFAAPLSGQQDDHSRETEVSEREVDKHRSRLASEIEELRRRGADESEIAEREKQFEGLLRERDPDAPRMGLARYAALNVGQRPRRVAPGQSGELVIVVSLRGEYVMKTSGHNLVYSREMGPLQLGEWSMLPPEPAGLYPEFAGQAIYDNTATVVVPFTVDPEAEFGKVPVRLAANMEITHAHTGQAMGTFIGEAIGNVNVGPPLPVVQIDGLDAVREARADAPDLGANLAADAEPQAPKSDLGADLADVEARGPAGRESPAGGGLALPEEGGSGSWLLIGAGGLALALGAILVLARRR
jgi:hypothetical protein